MMRRDEIPYAVDSCESSGEDDVSDIQPDSGEDGGDYVSNIPPPAPPAWYPSLIGIPLYQSQGCLPHPGFTFLHDSGGNSLGGNLLSSSDISASRKRARDSSSAQPSSQPIDVTADFVSPYTLHLQERFQQEIDRLWDLQEAFTDALCMDFQKQMKKNAELHQVSLNNLLLEKELQTQQLGSQLLELSRQNGALRNQVQELSSQNEALRNQARYRASVNPKFHR